MKYRIGFGDVQIGNIARGYLNQALERNWISEGPNVQKLEENLQNSSAIVMPLPPVLEPMLALSL